MNLFGRRPHPPAPLGLVWAILDKHTDRLLQDENGAVVVFWSAGGAANAARMHAITEGGGLTAIREWEKRYAVWPMAGEEEAS